MRDSPAPATIIGGVVSPYVRKVLAVCAIKGVPFRLDPIIPFYGDDRFTAISPLRRIPVFIDDQVTLSMQYSTQWYGLCHVGAMFDIHGDGEPRRVYYNGYAAGVDVFGGADADACCPPGGSYARKLSVSRYAEKGMQGRGVLVDLERAFGPGRKLVGHAELQAAMLAQNVSVESGDHSEAWLKTFADAVSAMPEVMEFYRMAGDVDYMLRVVVADMQSYDAFYKKLIGSVALKNVTSRFAMEKIKSVTALPVPALG